MRRIRERKRDNMTERWTDEKKSAYTRQERDRERRMLETIEREIENRRRPRERGAGEHEGGGTEIADVGEAARSGGVVQTGAGQVARRAPHRTGRGGRGGCLATGLPAAGQSSVIK